MLARARSRGTMSAKVGRQVGSVSQQSLQLHGKGRMRVQNERLTYRRLGSTTAGCLSNSYECTPHERQVLGQSGKGCCPWARQLLCGRHRRAPAREHQLRDLRDLASCEA